MSGPRPRPAAGGGRWVQVAPERLERWLAGFLDCHGDGGWILEDGVVAISGADGTRALCHPPFPPLVTDPTLPYSGALAHALTDRRVGVLLVRRGSHAAGIFAGSALIASKVGSRHVQGRTAAGGWSQQRFARRRAGQTHVALGAAADVAARVLVDEAVPAVDHLVTGGDRRLLAQVLEDPRLAGLRPRVIERVLDVPDPKLTVLRATPTAFRAVHIWCAIAEVRSRFDVRPQVSYDEPPRDEPPRAACHNRWPGERSRLESSGARLSTEGHTMTAQAEVAASKKRGTRVAVQKFGTFLSGMIMPNIAAFIAWGLITAFFIETGWTPVAGIGGFGVDENGDPNVGLVGPMIRFMLPLLIAMQGGAMVYGVRGSVVGVVATMGVIMSTDQPMFLGGMIMGPLAAFVMKHLDKLWHAKIKPGFEMLVNNFSAGIVSAAMAVAGFFAFGPIIEGVSAALGDGVDWLISNSLLPLASIIIEPAKVLFLNNAINHGVLTPLGVSQSIESGKSILFLLEANPGPGMGLLLAYCIFGTGLAKSTAPAAAIIHFFGGIHEIFFPYVLMKPILLLATISGGMVGIFTLTIFDAGLRAPAAPGSILAVLAQTPGDSVFGVLLSVLLAATTSFIIASLILKASRKGEEGGDLAAATASMEAMKGKKSSVSGVLSKGGEASGAGPAAGVEAPAEPLAGALPSKPIHKIVFACDAGMGSSAMGASVLRNKVKKAGFSDVTVINLAIANLVDDADLIVTHQDLTARAVEKAPSAQHVSVDNFMNSPKYDEVVEQLKVTNAQGSSAPS